MLFLVVFGCFLIVVCVFSFLCVVCACLLFDFVCLKTISC